MRRKISILLVLALVASLCMVFVPAQAAETTDYLTVEKSTYSKTEEIKVKVNALPDPLPNNLYIALYVYPYTIGSTTGAVWINVNVNNQQTVFEGDTITITQNANTRVGAYSVALLEYKTNGTIEDNIIHIGPCFEPTKEEFTVGEDITINYRDISTSIGDCWLGLYKKDQGTDTRNQMWTYFVNGGSLTRGESGTLTIPDDMESGEMTGGALPEGEYKVVLLKNSDKSVLSNVAYFKVGAPAKTPVLSVENDTITEGEDLVVSYADVTDKLGKGVWLAVYKKDATLGSDQSYVWVMLTNSSDGSLVHSESGTFTFPQDAEGGSVYQGKATLTAGEYEVMVLGANYEVLSERVSITIQAKNIPTGDASMVLIAVMMVCASGALVFVKRKQYN